METTDIVIHKGEKEDKYQLYVEDYVMSYLKKYKGADGRKIFFYGTREQKNKKYYIYGAGRQKNISYFVRYELLEEIVCRYDMDMPVFSVKEEEGRYELAGYYIFYQSNEAMQSYMIEQKKDGESGEKEEDKLKLHSKIRPQDFSDIRARSGLRTAEGVQQETSPKEAVAATPMRTNVRKKREKAEKSGSGIMAIQLSAVFLILAAIIINSTNSYTKLKDLGQSAIEVFFTMENQEASDKAGKGQDAALSDKSGEEQDAALSDKSGEEQDATISDKTVTDNNEVSQNSREQKVEGSKQPGGTTLRLEDLDAEFEKENQAAKQEGDEDGNDSGEKDNVNDTTSTSDNVKGATDEEDNVNDTTGTSNNAKDSTGEGDKTNDSSDEGDKSEAALSPSQEAFARNIAEYYQIEKGDTLCNISIKVYGDASKVKEICEINKIADPDNIKYGQKILLP